MSDLKKSIASLTPEQRAQLMRRMQEKSARPQQAAPIPRRADTGPAPLSFAQQRLWFLDQLEPGTDLFNVAVAMRLEGTLDVRALEQSLTELVRRHEALRTTFRAEGTAPVQQVQPPSPVTLPVQDLQSLPAEHREAEARNRAQTESQRPFDLTRGPLLRTLLMRLAPDDHVLVLTMHHIVTDGWSLGLMTREVTALYPAFAEGRASPLPELSLQYPDYALWQREFLQGEAMGKQLTWWREQLGDASVLELPTDKPRPATRSHRGTNVHFRLPRELSESFKALCHTEGVTPFMGFLAAFQLLLSRLSGQEDLTVGSPIAGRSRPELEPLVGFFVNTLVFRNRLSPTSTFRELLAQVKRTTLDAYAHQDVPFDKLVEVLQPTRDLSRSPLFQVLLTLQNAPMPALQLPGLTFRGFDLESRISEFDLSLSLVDAPEGWTGALDYDTELFEEASARRLLSSLQALLEGLVAAPERRLCELPLLSPADRLHVLEEARGAKVTYPLEQPVHRLFEAQVSRTPEAIALRDGAKTLSYAELDARANRWAHYLRRRGVGPGTFAGVLLDRSVDALIAFLGVLKAGGAYVPLDPEYPRDRLEFILRDSGARVLLTKTHLLERVGGVDGPDVVDMDTLRVAVARESEESPTVAMSSESLAYLIYTSGSTGQPKAVMTPHRALASYALGNARIYGLTSEDRVLQFSTLSFDQSAEEIYPPLLTGGTVVLRTDAMLEARTFCESCAEWGITLLFLPTAFWVELTSALARGAARLPPSVRVVATGGEKVPASAVIDWRRTVPRTVRLTNEYGPTESTIICIVGDLDPVSEESLRQGGVPIGRPSPNVSAYVLDPWMQPVPQGLPGELYLGGESLAHGYHGRPDLTAERFLPDPYADTPGARLYRTGDIVRSRSDGNLEFVGRVDHQVKLRGFRIELGEIEAALRAHPSVQDALVLVRQDPPANDKRLVAYCVPKTPRPQGEGGLRDHLRKHLPEYMVPKAFVILDTFPLTPSGKIDRKALPAPEATPALAEAQVLPRTPLERDLARIWEDLLQVRPIGVTSSFFELGGHSLLATKVVARIRSTLGIEVPLRTLFEAPTLESLAQRLQPRQDDPSRLTGAPPLVKAERGATLPLSFAQQRVWFLDHLQPGATLYNMPTALRIEGPLDVPALERAFAALLRRHETLRTTFHDEAGTPVQRVHPPSDFHLPVLDLGTRPDAPAEVQRLAREEALRPFTLSTCPLVRASLLRLSGAEHVLLLTLHHIVSDGWSIGVLVRDVGALYESFRQGLGPTLPELPIQYADYALWQRQWLTGDVLEQQVSWWKHQLAGAPHALDLPTDFPRPPVLSTQGATVPVRWSPELSEAVDRLARREGATTFMLVLAAFQLLLSRYSGQDDVSVGTPIAGRRHAEVEGLIGFFLNSLVLRARLAGPGTFRELLAQVRESTLGAYEYQDVPFEKLVEELQPQRDLSRSPLFQVMFDLHNKTPTAPSNAFEGLKLSPLDAVAGATNKFELTLDLGYEDDGGLSGLLEYNTDLFDGPTVARMAEHLRVLVTSVVANPDAPLANHSLLGAEERSRLLTEWAGSDADFPEGACLHDLVVPATRERLSVALESEAGTVTYGELEQRANQLAWHLRAFGVGPESRVALCLERSPDLVVGMLGILKAGAAYVPLDPTLPAARLAFLIEDSRAAVLLTQERLEDRLPAFAGITVFLDADTAQIAGHPEEAPTPGVTPDNAAYVIYTSGSTGKPKGVVVSHRSVCNLVHWEQRKYAIGPTSRVLQFANASFDLSVEEIFTTLTAGGTLRLLMPEQVMPGPTLQALLRRSSISVLSLTPAVLAATPSDDLPDLRTVISGGEACSAELVSRWAPGRTFLNTYGPTEGTVVATLTGCEAGERRAPPIGRPLPNVRVYVLDARLDLVPEGIPGELYLGGVGLARGYLERPALTAERFVPNPFSATPGARLYRTGDKVRWRADGQLEYLGRVDSQVKLRGLRIELGEIEAVLAEHRAVREVVVLAREDVPGDKRLVAYVVGAEDEAPDAKTLRAFLQQKLPEYLVPSAIVVLPALPLNANGKVDRRALPAPETSARDGEGFVPPRDEFEKRVAAIWAEVLHVERVGLHDDFFDLGGHSLLAVQLISRLRSILGVDMVVQTVFEATTLEAMAGLLRKRESLLDGSAYAKTSSVPPPRRRPEDAPPTLASFAQQRLWVLDRMEPGGTAFHIPLTVRLDGDLDVGALEQALNEVVRRHESLRTTFREGPDGPVLDVAPPAPFHLSVTDLSTLEADAREARTQQLVDENALAPFDLAKGPLWRPGLLRLSEREHALLLTVHHIVFDGWSQAVLIREVATLYDAFTAGRPSPLPELPLQYGDFASWQREYLSGETLESELGYWRHQLDGLGALDLPTDHPRPERPTHPSGLHPIQLAPPLSTALVELCRREGLTPFMALLAAFQLLLARHSGQEDVAVGSPIAGRNHGELEGLIGFFLNTLVLRTRLEGVGTFRELLKRVRDVALGAFAHQHVPFEELQPLRGLDQAPLFRAMFMLQNLPESELELPGLSLRALDAARQEAKFDLTLTLTEGAGGFEGTLEYDAGLFEPTTAARLATHFGVLVERMVADPDQRLSSVSLLSEEDRRRLFVDWNDTRAEFPESCIHHLFEAQARRTPDAPAVESGDAILTYRELDARANALAHFLRKQGVAPETLVGLCLERSPDMVIAVLAVLKAGGAYLPLDPAHPSERLAFMLKDSAAGVLVTQRTLVDRIPEGTTRTLVLDEAREAIDRESPEAPVVSVGTGSLAYVIYTSGSTGRPKGTLVEHRGVANLVTHEARLYGVGPGSRMLQFANLGFDISVEELFTTLCSGGTVCLAPSERLAPGRPLQELLREARITMVSLTPAALAATPAEALPELRTVISGGEACTAEVVSRWAPGRAFLNTYGPTEATVIATLTACEADGRTPSIGRPLPNVRAYVLDRALQPVLPGVKGELCIGGVGVTRGYLGRPDLTSEKFIPDPFSGVTGARLYRTGDLVRHLPNGELEFAGRIDSQVKVRGYRIELGEIEAAINDWPIVRESVVLAKNDVPGGTRLIAYVVSRLGNLPGAPSLDVAPLRSALRKRLPEYMIPSVFVSLETMPLTPHGKVDRKALPEPELAEGAENYVAPTTTTEARLAELWAQLLGAKRVGLRDNFFDLGGHSLLATQAVSRIRQAFGVEIPLRGLFESPTLEGVAKLIDDLLSGATARTPSRKAPKARATELPVVPLEEQAARETSIPKEAPSPLTEEERHRVLVEWNASAEARPAGACMHQLVAMQAERTPDTVALEYGEDRLTYQELHRRANQLAHHLRASGVGPESRVALCLERSLELVVGMLGVLKAGGAFVPLDVTYPSDRLRFMIEDSAPQVIITQAGLAKTLPTGDRTLLFLDTEAEAIARRPEVTPITGVTEENLAYVIYTSGSTGLPKGTLLLHRGLCNTALAAAAAHHVSSDSRVLQFASSSFDASVCEVFSTLVAGATLVLSPRERLLPDAPLRSLLSDHRISTVTLTPSVLAQLSPDGLPHLQTVISAGEALPLDVARRWSQGRALLNAYGPTEVTVCAAITPFPGVAQADRITLGSPWPNTSLFVLDASLRPVPIGVPGELFVSGLGLARGYLHQPSLTAERFLPNPFSSSPGSRLYRTGDRVRWLPSGELEYLGRLDSQVKLRGFRIELGEIEAVLSRHPDVREAAVVLRDERLVAYWVASSLPEGGDQGEGALRDWLRSSLPEHQIPAIFVRLDALPLSPAGKLDRAALPIPPASTSDRPYRPPSTDTEKRLATLWQRILRLDRISTDERFFDLGGHSLTATQVLSRVRQHFQTELPLQALFESPTIELLARRIDTTRAPGTTPSIPPIAPSERTSPPPLSFAQQRLWFLARLEPDSPAYNLPTAVRLTGALDLPAFTRALRDLHQRHEVLRTTFREEDTGPVQVIAPAPRLPASWLDLSVLSEPAREAEIQRLAQDEAERPFDLEAGPLWRVLLARLGAREHVLYLTLHHAIADAWSMGVLIQELTTLYRAHAEDRSAALSPLPIQYADFAEWQRSWLRDTVLEAQLDWWREQLRDAPAALDLPTDRPRPALQTFNGAVESVHLSRELSDSLFTLCRREGVTPSMALLTLFQVLLSRYSGQDDISVGTPIAGRHHADLEGLIGFFVNTLVLRTRLEGDPSFQSLLARVRDTALGAYAHQDVPFEKLVEALRPARDTARPPLFQVMFAYQNAPMPDAMGSELGLHPIEVENRTAKFDLTLALTETPRGLEGTLEYNTDLYDAETAARMVGHLRALVEGAVDAPSRPLSTLSMLTPEERHLLFHASHGPGTGSLHRLLAAQARKTPEAVAETSGDQTLTRAEVYRRARELARPEAPTRPPPLQRTPRAGPTPLSFAQQRLWFLDQLEPGNAFYNIPAHTLLEGPLDVTALERSFTEVLRRHESLRTVFQSEASGPLQVVQPLTGPTLQHIDLSPLEASAREAEVRRLADAETQRAFDLARGPLLRATLLRLGEQRHALLLVMHHIAADGWSTELLLREVGALYGAFSQGQASPLPELPLQYADFALWQRSWLQGAVLDAQLSWWRKQLAGAERALELPTDHPRPPVLTHRGRMMPVAFPRELSVALQALCRRESVTPFMAGLAAFQVLLARHASQEDVSVGTPIAGRNHEELEGLIGFFVNTLVLRARIPRHVTFRELLAQVRETALGAYAHQDVPFEKLVEELRPERDLARAPLFQVLFAFQSGAPASASLPGISVQGLESESRTAKFELSLDLMDTSDGLSGAIEFNTDLFDESTVTRMMEHFQRLLEGLLQAPEQRVWDVPLLGSDERRKLLVDWNQARRDVPPGAVAHALFEAQVDRAPDALAIEDEGGTLSYRELDQRANRLARRLKAAGVGPEVRVALCLGRTHELVVGMLAVLKAGGAFVPVDPSYPTERQRFMLDDSGARLVLTTSSMAESLRASASQGVMEVTTNEASRSDDARRLDSINVGPENLAYVIYTSGSTGLPKGTLLLHRGLCNTALAAAAAHHVSSDSRVLQFASSSFDASVCEVFSTLVAGATLVLSPRERLLPDAPLRSLLSDHRISTVTLTPSVLAQLSPDGLPHLQTVISAGEALPLDVARRWSQGRALLNAYGPTEVTVCAAITPFPGVAQADRITLGTPWPNTSLFVLDASLRPVPIGVPGELFISGLGLARGYLSQPSLTAERFLPNPFSSSPGSRLYRTGDRVRWLPSGELEYLGRLDSQVKLRGFRIELGEIEAVLSRHPDVREAAVVLRDERLIAYWVASSLPERGDQGEGALRDWLRSSLPEHQIPAIFVRLDALPLSPAGKLDRAALPTPERQQAPTNTYVAPRDSLEAHLATLWSEVLRVDRIGIHDNLFDLGGHSLLAVRLASKLQPHLHRPVPVSLLFRAPTIAQLAARLRQDAGPWTPLVPLQPEGAQRPLFCVHPVGGQVLAYAELARQLGPDQPSYALEAQGLDGQRAPLASIQEMAALHIEAIRTVQPQGPYRLGGWSMGGVIAQEMAHQLEQQGETVELLALIDPSPAVPTDPLLQASDLQRAEHFASDLAQIAGLDEALFSDLPADTTPDILLTRLSQTARDVGAPLPDLPGLHALLRVFTANLSALRNHTPRTFHGDATIFRASETPDPESSDRGWAPHITGGLSTQVLAGHHYSLLRAPTVHTLAEKLRVLLQRTTAAFRAAP